MEAILINISGGVITISDLGIELQDGDSTDLIENYTIENIIKSIDLESSLIADCAIEVNGVDKTYDELIELLTALTKYEHQELPTLKHNISEGSFFETTKVGGLTKYITTWVDNTKTVKIYEEEVIRNVNNSASSLIITRYKNGILKETETQILNRDVDGRVENINIIGG